MTSLFVESDEDIPGPGLDAQPKQSERDAPKTPDSKAKPAAPTCSDKVEEVPKASQAKPSPQAKEKESSSDDHVVNDTLTHQEKSSSGLSEGENSAEQVTDATDRTAETAAPVPRDPRIRNNTGLSQPTAAKNGSLPPTIPTKRVNESASNPPAEKRTKLTPLPTAESAPTATAPTKQQWDSPLPAPGFSPSITATTKKQGAVIPIHRQVADLRKNRKKMAEQLKEVNEKLAPHAATIEQLFAREKEEHDREAEELKARLELLAYLESEGLMDTE